MPIYPGSVLGDVVSMLVAVKTADGRVFWIGGESRDCTVTFRRDPREGLAEWVLQRGAYDYLGPPEPPSVEVQAIITDYTGEWREGVPDVPKALGSGTEQIEPPSVPLLPDARPGVE